MENRVDKRDVERHLDYLTQHGVDTRKLREWFNALLDAQQQAGQQVSVIHACTIAQEIIHREHCDSHPQGQAEACLLLEQSIAQLRRPSPSIADVIAKVREIGQQWYGEAKRRGAAFSDKGRIAEQIATALESLHPSGVTLVDREVAAKIADSFFASRDARRWTPLQVAGQIGIEIAALPGYGEPKR